MTQAPNVAHVQADSPAADAAVFFDNVGKTYRSSAGLVHALQGVSLTVRRGSIFGIIGRSGAGKSSLLRTVNRLEDASEGRVWVEGVDIGQLSEAQLVQQRRRIGMIFQHFNLLSAKTVWENVALPLQVAGVPKAQVESRVTELLELVGLADKHKTYPSRLSGGQKQRVGIARALVHNPPILLCDEATSALDPETTQSILQLLRDINRRLGITIILITHEMSVIREIADEVLVLEQGRMAELGPVWQVFGNPQHDATRALLAPLQHGLPEDVALQLQADRPTGNHSVVLALDFNGQGQLEPNLSQLIQHFGESLRLLQGGVDRIQGHAQGRMIVAVDGAQFTAINPLWINGEHPLAHRIEVLGFIA